MVLKWGRMGLKVGLVAFLKKESHLNSLNDRKVISAKPKKDTYSLNDGNGLYLFVTVRGRKVWRYRYKYQGKDLLYTIGDYPDFEQSK